MQPILCVIEFRAKFPEMDMLSLMGSDKTNYVQVRIVAYLDHIKWGFITIFSRFSNICWIRKTSLNQTLAQN